MFKGALEVILNVNVLLSGPLKGGKWICRKSILKDGCFRPAREGLFSPDPNMVSVNQLGRGTGKDVKNIENR